MKKQVGKSQEPCRSLKTNNKTERYSQRVRETLRPSPKKEEIISYLQKIFTCENFAVERKKTDSRLPFSSFCLPSVLVFVLLLFCFYTLYQVFLFYRSACLLFFFSDEMWQAPSVADYCFLVFLVCDHGDWPSVLSAPLLILFPALSSPIFPVLLLSSLLSFSPLSFFSCMECSDFMVVDSSDLDAARNSKSGVEGKLTLRSEGKREMRTHNEQMKARKE